MNVSEPSPLDAALERLTRLHPKKIDLSLDRIARLLEALDRPQDWLPPVVHVAGTNGKGSTLAFLKAMIESSGQSAHVYSSPHLVRFNERIVLKGGEVDDARLTDALNRIEAANDGAPITFFEVTTAAAFLLFSETPADYLLLETGLGGKYDATNVVAKPAVTAITPISLDHREFLGHDLTDIAREKAGIFKPGAPAYSAGQAEDVRGALARAAEAAGAPFYQAGVDFMAWLERGRMVFQNAERVMDLPPPGLMGAHQVQNAGLAAALALHLGLETQAISDGVANARWPARMQRLSRGRFADMANAAGAELWLDAAHNPGGAASLAAVLADLEVRNPKPLVLIMGAMANKDLEGIAAPFAGLAAELIAVPLKDEAASADPGLIAMAAAEGGLNASIAPSLTTGLKEALERHGAARVVIFGSLRLGGEALGD